MGVDRNCKGLGLGLNYSDSEVEFRFIRVI